MKILVTGGAGFQGSHIVEYLLMKGHQITILNHRSDVAERNISSFRDKINVIWGSVVDKTLVESLVPKYDIILHLAAKIHVDESIVNPFLYLQKNVDGTFRILEAIKKCQKNRPRLIYWSSCEVYGEPMKGKLSESSELRPQSPYAATKAAADCLCSAYYKTYGLEITTVRPFNIFGERQKIGIYGSLIPTMVENAINKKPLIIFGEGKQTRDYTYITDLVSIFEIIFNHRKLAGEVINFASGVNTPVVDIAKYIAKRFKAEIIHVPRRPGEVMKFPADISKAKRLGFKPKISIWEGIERYIDWRLLQKSLAPAPSKYSDFLHLRKLYERFLQLN